MTVGDEALGAVVARIDERVLALMHRFDAYTETEVMLRADIALVKDEARQENTAVRVDLERQIAGVTAALEKHERAVNPHPNQEDWLRRSADRLAVAIDALRGDLGAMRTEITTARGTVTGAAKVLYPLGSVGLVAIGAVLNRYLGG